MHFNKSFALLACFLLPAGCGEPTYDLRTVSQPGEILRTESTMRMNGGTITFSADGRSVSGTMESTIELATETDILEAEDGRPTKLKLATPRSRTTWKMVIDGQTEEMTESDALEGRSVVLTKSGDAWKGRLVGGSPTAEQAQGIAELETTAEQNELIPDRELRVGESWTIADEPLRRHLGGYEKSGFSGGKPSCTLNRLSISMESRAPSCRCKLTPPAASLSRPR